MSATIATTSRPPREPRNGVDTPTLFATINVVKENPPLAKFRLRASSKWVDGTCSESIVESFFGAGTEHQHKTEFRYTADHPTVLVGQHRGPRRDVDVGRVAGRGRPQRDGRVGIG